MTRDFYLGGLAGLITGLLVIPILKNFSISILYGIVIVPLSLGVLFGAGILIARWLKQWIPWFFQFSKFVATGFMNAAIDFGILNLLIYSSGISAGAGYIAFKALSFLVANANSYAWNRWWVFKRSALAASSNTGREYAQFLTVSAVGIIINVGAAAIVVNGLDPQFGLGATAWANVGAIAGSAAGLLWNFLGYKFIVFRS